MRVSMRVKLAVVVALFAAVFMVGSAWAAQTAQQVADRITAFGLSAAISGNTITVTNVGGTSLVKDVKTATITQLDPEWYGLLCLDDITGLTIDWKANLTVTGEQSVNEGDYIAAIVFWNGTFNMLEGKIELQTTGTGYTTTVDGTERSTINIRGGTIRGLGEGHNGPIADSERKGVINVTGGTIDFPNSIAISATSLTISGGSINGIAADYGDNNDDEVYIYGTTNSSEPFDYDEPPVSIHYTVKSGAVWTVSSDVLLMATDKYTGVVENGGKMILVGDGAVDVRGNFTADDSGEIIVSDDVTLNVHGTVINKGTFTVNENATINVISGNTFDNQGTLRNMGTINITSTGRMKSTGTINNNGTINNEGTFESVQTKEEMGGTVNGNAVEPIDDTTNPSSGGSSGCNTGFGMFALAALALPFMKRK